MTGPELERLSGAVRFMQLHCWPSRGRRQRALWWATVNKGSRRKLIADVQKRITRSQKLLGLPPYNTTVFESRGGLHAHIVFIGNSEIAIRLQRSAAFGTSIVVEPVTDAEALVTEYLAKERTPQAGYRRSHLLGGRIGGSHRLDGGGDRVRLSRDLERDAIEVGYVEPWVHTNAKRRRGGENADRASGSAPMVPTLDPPDRPLRQPQQSEAGRLPPAAPRLQRGAGRRRLRHHADHAPGSSKIERLS
jgi:hypothetical protein